MAIKRKKNGNGSKAIDASLGALRDDIEALQENMKSLVVDAGDVANDRVRQAVRATENTAQQVLDDVEEWANGNVSSLRDKVREQPFTSCILSLSAGALMGALFLRR
ncbi:MAG: hypothetical protein ABSC92_10400 [Rhizomicrobium sp.]|jgi:ElaB/YqjD/DUF883 family membrane-anchored ribosome-binding protein